MIEYTKKINAKLVYVSSVYSLPYEENKVIKEINYFNLDNQDGLYAYIKAKMNNYILNECKNGLKANIVMPSSLVGPHDLNNSY